jgi:sensor histidine kinase YesM
VKRKQIILIHVIFWSVMTTFTGLQIIPSIGKTEWSFIAGDYTIYALSYVSFFYLYYFFISKEFFAKKKTTFLIIFGLLFVIIITLPITYIYIYLLESKVYELSGRKFLLNFGVYFFRIFETNFMYAMCGSLLKVALQWYENLMRQKEAEKQLVAGELALLRSQINPRFLLNTLKYVKSLIDTRPEKAVYSIENLSEIMSYMLYETSAEKVPLDKEINYVNNYLNLQGVRYRPEFIRFEVTGSAAGILVPPLVFMPFLENTFLYADESAGTPAVAIRLDIKDSELAFEIMNYRKEKPGLVRSDEGFDTDTIKRCLDLLFGKNYSLDMKNDGSKHLVKLNIKPAG